MVKLLLTSPLPLFSQVKNLATGKDRHPSLGMKLALELSKNMKKETVS